MWVEIIKRIGRFLCRPCHPLREDVSWNVLSTYCVVPVPMSSSSWGCELKFNAVETSSGVYVILFVRMWVEMYLIMTNLRMYIRHPLREDVSWNCNLSCSLCYSYCHPLREDVSWNTVTFNPLCAETCHPLREDVSWNLLLFQNHQYFVRHPLREDVSWNEYIGIVKPLGNVILFVRMWVEMSYLFCIF